MPEAVAEQARRSQGHYRDAYANEAIGVSFWEPKESPRPAQVLPIRPDNQAGRIGQQSSRFTLHMHRAEALPHSYIEAHQDSRQSETRHAGWAEETQYQRVFDVRTI